MYEEWPFFREMIDLIAMTLSKTDFSISAAYELQLAEHADSQLKSLGESIRSELVRTRKNVLSVTGCDDLSNGFGLLKRSMRVRNPYVDPLNVIQAEMLKRLRRAAPTGTDGPALALDPEEKALLEDTIIVSINGIAQGMKNSG